MPDLKLDVLLFSNEDPKYNRDAEILAQFLNELQEKYPSLVLNQYDADKVEGLTQKLNLDNRQRKFPVFILNGEILICDGIPTIEDMDKIIQKIL